MPISYLFPITFPAVALIILLSAVNSDTFMDQREFGYFVNLHRFCQHGNPMDYAISTKGVLACFPHYLQHTSAKWEGDIHNFCPLASHNLNEG